jgi:hypothetical protein
MSLRFFVCLSALVCLLILPYQKLLAFSSESLSFFETPSTYELNGGVLAINTLLDFRYVSQDSGNAKFDDFAARGSLSYQKQLSNDWDLTISYLADYQKERSDDYQDLFRIGLQDQWGEVILGDISTLVYERTNREVAAGLLGSDNDMFTLPLETYGVFYQFNTPATQWMAALDSDGNVELGASMYIPIKAFEYQLSARLNSNENDEGDAQGVQDNQGVAVVAQVQRGRWIADIQYMREELSLLSSDSDIRLNTVSAGLHYAFNRAKWSLTGISRENELNDEERQVSVGLRYYLARGFTFNLGASVNNSKLFKKRFYSTATSLRYEF